MRGRRELTIGLILADADAFHRRTGRWPYRTSGRIVGSLGDTWSAVNLALCKGSRGLPGGSSLPQLLQERRGVRNRGRLPRFTIGQILGWADAHHRRTGAWPRLTSGAIASAPGETWQAVQDALVMGHRGLPGGSSLARILARHRGVRNIQDRPPFTIKQILAWADAHHRRTGRWPIRASGSIADASGETWAYVINALIQGNRGFPGGISLAQLLAQGRGVRNRKALPRLRVKDILAWADAHYRRTGRWPRHTSGAIVDARGETWAGVEAALQHGNRGFPGGYSLYGLLKRHRHIPGRRSHARPRDGASPQ
jgi:hypothetical protein